MALETSTSSRPQPKPRSAFNVFMPISTRWSDNDVYGHINNVTYYSFFDTAVNSWLISQGVLDIERGRVIGLVVHTQCHYFTPLSFPQALEAGLAVARIGTSSVSYKVGVFARGADATAAHGQFVHVYVDRATQKPVHLPQALKKALEKLHLDPSTQFSHTASH
jgi:acyl-CoA thioester hydrolase